MLDRHRHLPTSVRWMLFFATLLAIQVFSPAPDMPEITCRSEFALADASGLDPECSIWYDPETDPMVIGEKSVTEDGVRGLLTAANSGSDHWEPLRRGIDWTREILVSAGLMKDPEERCFRVVSVSSNRTMRLLRWPVHGSISSPYGMRRHPVLRRRSFHGAIDIRARVGTPVIAPADGIVKTACRAGALGHMIRVQVGETVLTFAHLSRYRVKVGQRVSRGQILGLVGSSGRATGPHLHFAVSIRGRTVNPLTVLGQG